MLLSGIMLKMAIYGVLRYLLPSILQMQSYRNFWASSDYLGSTVVYGALIAIVHNDIKKIIAYSSLSHVGLTVAGIFASAIITAKGGFSIDGAQGALVQTFAHGT